MREQFASIVSALDGIKESVAALQRAADAKDQALATIIVNLRHNCPPEMILEWWGTEGRAALNKEGMGDD